MPAVTPHRTNHGRRDIAFRGTRADPFAMPAAIEKRERRTKRLLINKAKALLNEPDLLVAARKLVAIKRRWVTVGSGGVEYERGLRREFDDVLKAFRARVRAARVNTPGTARADRPGAQHESVALDPVEIAPTSRHRHTTERNPATTPTSSHR